MPDTCFAAGGTQGGAVDCGPGLGASERNSTTVCPDCPDGRKQRRVATRTPGRVFHVKPSVSAPGNPRNRVGPVGTAQGLPDRVAARPWRRDPRLGRDALIRPTRHGKRIQSNSSVITSVAAG